MKMVMAIINEDKLQDVIDGLIAKNILGITISDIKGFGNIPASNINDVSKNQLNKKVKLEIVVANEEDKNTTIEVITENAHDLNIGAGKIFVYNIEEVYRIRTGERDAVALR